MLDQRPAELRVSATAVVDEIGREIADAIQLGPVDDRPAMALRGDQPGATKAGEVRRHGVLRHVEETRDLARGDARRLPGDKQAQGTEPRGLSKSGKALKGNRWFHASRTNDA